MTNASRLVTIPAWAFAMVVALACDPSTDRPAFGPLSGATIDTVVAKPDIVIAVLGTIMDSVGIRKRSESVRDGYLETRGYDVQASRPRARDMYHPERVVVFRFWADLIPGDRTRLTGEATYRKTDDPSLDSRMAETVATPDHPAYTLLQEILTQAKRQAGG